MKPSDQVYMAQERGLSITQLGACRGQLSAKLNQEYSLLMFKEFVKERRNGRKEKQMVRKSL